MQVVSNLLANAVKFAPVGGKVVVRVEQRDDLVEVSVEDDGPGIAAAEVPSLFQRYARLERPTRKVEGTGLGLMIVREIVDAHGGTVGVDSEEGKGSRFWFRLPSRGPGRLRTPSQLRLADVPAPASILVVDDDEDIRLMLSSLLEGEGYDVRMAVDGADALHQLSTRSLPDAILLDLGMPNVDGREFRRLQLLDGRLEGIPAIVISAECGLGDDASLSVRHFLHKPFDFDRVLYALNDVLKRRRRPSQPPQPTSAA